MSEISVAVMAGGKSSRMGQNKSFLLVDGQPMIERVLNQVSDLGNETILITNEPTTYAHLNLPMFADLYPDHGPLAGIYTAVHQASSPHVLIVATDMPWLNRSLLTHMISLRTVADVIMPRWEKYPEPLHAIYGRTCLPAIQAQLEAKELKITRFLNQVSVRFVDREEIVQFDPNGRSFLNINTPEELERWQSKPD